METLTEILGTAFGIFLSSLPLIYVIDIIIREWKMDTHDRKLRQLAREERKRQQKARKRRKSKTNS